MRRAVLSGRAVLFRESRIEPTLPLTTHGREDFMRIVSATDEEFIALQASLERSRLIGSYRKGELLRTVNVSRQLIIVLLEEDPSRMGVHEAPSLYEADRLANRVLLREKKRGNEVLFSEP